MRRKWKRPLALFMLAIITLLAASGCQNNGGTGNGGKNADGGREGNTGTAKGRYMEEDMEFPLQEGEETLNLIKTKEGRPVLFAKANDTQVKRYEYDGEQWNQTPLEWFGQISKEQEIYPLEVQETDGGTQFISWLDDEALMHIARSDDGKTLEELSIPYLAQRTEYGYPLINGFVVDNAGNYWLQDAYASKIAVIAGDTLETIQEINTVQSFNMSQHLIFSGEDALALNTEDNVFSIYNEKLETRGVLSVEKADQICMCGDKEHWYVISEKGITRLTVGNDIQEVIMDGSMGAMGSSTNYAVGAVRGQEDDFYVLYTQEKSGTYSLKHYVYEPEASAVQGQTLRVFGLADSDTVREAAIGFQKKYPDVKVEFTTSGKQAGEVTSDDIRTLNTELLSGNGADVLLLDGLPVDAYIEKGILADLSGTVEKLMGADDYLETILKNTAQKDGKVYGLPAKFIVPIIFGNEDAKKALESLESLKAFLEQDPSASVFGIADIHYIRDFLFQMYQNEIFGEDGKVDQEKLEELLELEGKIAVNAKSSLFEADMMGWNESGDTRNPFLNYGAEGIIKHPEGAATTSISSISDMIIPYAVMRQQNLAPDTIRGFYLPVSIVGINQNTSQPEIAEDFVEYLFSQEVQCAQLDDGFPVLKSALEDKKNEVGSEYANSFYITSSWNFDGEDEIMLEAGYPTLEEVEEFIQMCGSLTTSAEQNRVIWNLYQKEANEYLEGNIDAATAARNVAQKVDTYLAE